MLFGMALVKKGMTPLFPALAAADHAGGNPVHLLAGGLTRHPEDQDPCRNTAEPTVSPLR